MYPQQQPSTIPNFFQVLVTLIHKIDDTPSYTKTQWSALVLLSFGVFLAVVGESSSVGQGSKRRLDEELSVEYFLFDSEFVLIEAARL